jgi:hypothetical protein
VKVGPALLAKLLQPCPLGVSQPPNVAKSPQRRDGLGTRWMIDLGLGGSSSYVSKAGVAVGFLRRLWLVGV